jgi:hypothetical protein
MIPNFFIIGAPKCGTTALGEYLREHPNIFFSTPKEPFFFDIDMKRIRMSLKTYLSLFKDADPNIHKAVGEGSVTYLFSKAAVQEMLKFNPGSKFIVMIRNPLDVVQAWHSTQLFVGKENIYDFEEAWRCGEEREKGNKIPFLVMEKNAIIYKNWGKLGEQVERLFSLVPKENVKVIVFEDFISDTRRIYEEVLSFLGVPFDNRNKFPTINENLVVANRRLHSVLRFMKIFYVIRAKFNLPIPLPEFLLMNAKTSKRSEISDKFREELRSFYRADVMKLSHLLGRDLTYWVSDTGNKMAE